MNSIDLHIHSSFSSDGEISPEHIVAMAHERGLQTISLTDHNSVRGVKRALEEARIKGLRVVPGIEIDCCLPYWKGEWWAWKPSVPTIPWKKPGIIWAEQKNTGPL